MSYKEVQDLVEVPMIAYLCSLFHEPLGTPDIEIQELEDSLVYNCPSEDDMFGGTFLDNLVISLLKGCIPSYKDKLTCRNYSLYLNQLFNSKIEEHEEERSPAVPCNITNPFDSQDHQEFSQLSVQDKLKAILQLIDIRLDTDDAPEKIKNIPVESLRLEHIAEDSEGALYWYFYGTRLYKQVKAKRQSKPKKSKKQQDQDKTKKDAKKSSSNKNKKEVEEEEGEGSLSSEDSFTDKGATPGWFLICQTEADWTNLAESLRKSKKKADKELFEMLEENYLPQINKMFQEKEREERLKVLMMNKRSSSRIVKKEQDRKVEEEKRKIEEEQLRKEEEKARKKRKEQEEFEELQRLKENFLARSRDTRGKNKTEKLIIEQESKVSREQRLMEREHRLAERELKRASIETKEQQEAAESAKKTRLDVERLRREAVERDHDYLGRRAAVGGGRGGGKSKSAVRTSESDDHNTAAVAVNGKRPQRAAAKKEWHRLADLEDLNHVRSIRL